jgi:MFS family permease
MSALKDARFRRLLIGYTLSTFGDSAMFLTLGIWAKDLTGSNGVAGSMFLALTLPGLASPLVGHIVDRLRRRRILIVNDVVAGLTMLPLLFVHGRDQLWLLYLAAATLGLSFTVLRSCRSALLKDLLPEADLAGANASLATVAQGVRLISPLAGAGLYAAAGGPSVAMLEVVSFAASALALASIRVRESAPEPVGERFRRSVTAGFRYVRRTPPLARLSAASALAFGVIGVVESTTFALLEHGLHRPTSFFGVLMCVQGAGSVLGGFTASPVVRRVGEPRAVGLGIGLLMVAVALYAVPVLPLVFVGLVCNGVALPWFTVGYVTALQRATPPRLSGRVTAAATLMLDVPQAASIGYGAALVASISYQVLNLGAAAVMALSAAILLLTPGSIVPVAGAPTEPVPAAVDPEPLPTPLPDPTPAA